jgi:cytidylate kinase
LLVAIDGPAGAGKSTVARAVAGELGFTYLDSGAMYRCVGLLALREPDRAPDALARAHRIWMRPAEQPNRGSSNVFVDDADVTRAIRTQEVSEAASRVAADPAVREVLVEKQRALLSKGDWVAEGRDIGTVVARDAPLKVFLTADPGARARRRAAELRADTGETEAAQARRDRLDAAQSEKATDALLLDATDLTLDQVIGEIARLARERWPAPLFLARPQLVGCPAQGQKGEGARACAGDKSS